MPNHVCIACRIGDHNNCTNCKGCGHIKESLQKKIQWPTVRFPVAENYPPLGSPEKPLQGIIGNSETGEEYIL